MFLTSLIIIIQIVLLEGLLSVDNSVVISMIANKAKPEDRPKVIKYGIIGAFLFRGLALFAVSWLMTNPEIGGIAKFIGAIYLIRMGYQIITPEADSVEEGEIPKWIESFFNFIGITGLWLVIGEVEFADFVFSIDNLFAAVAFTENIKGTVYGLPLNITLTIIGVFLGIITMRFITVKIMKLIEKYPSLNKSAGIVIFILGIKLLISGVFSILEIKYFTNEKIVSWLESTNKFLEPVKQVLENHYTDFVVSCVMMVIFIYPLLFNKNKN